MRKEKNIEIRVAKTKDTRFTADDFAKLCDERTKIIVISTVEWCNGWRMDLKEIGDFCKSKGIFLVVDAVQELGINKLDTKTFHVDILTAGGHKWLNSPFGTGVLYINKETLPKLKSVYHGYLNTKEPPEGWGGYWENPAAASVNDWEFDMTARKFEIGGTSNYPGAVALGETLELVNEIGIENIQSRVEELSAYCMEQLESIGATIITHKDPGRRAGIVIARIYEDLNTERAILKNLHAQNIFIAHRFTDYVGGYRISCQYFNNHKDIDTLVAALKEEIKKLEVYIVAGQTCFFCKAVYSFRFFIQKNFNAFSSFVQFCISSNRSSRDKEIPTKVSYLPSHHVFYSASPVGDFLQKCKGLQTL